MAKLVPVLMSIYLFTVSENESTWLAPSLWLPKIFLILYRKIVASRSIKTTISRINNPLLKAPPNPERIDVVNDIAAPGSNCSMMALLDICRPSCWKKSKNFSAELFTISLYCGKFCLKSLREVPKREAIAIPIETMPKMTTNIAPNIGRPLFLNFVTSGFAITEINIANKKGIKISLANFIPATTIENAAKLNITCCTWLWLLCDSSDIDEIKLRKLKKHSLIIL